MNVTGPIIDLIAGNTPAHALLAGRVYPQVLKQNTAYPAAAINVKDINPTNTKTGPSDMDRVLVQIDVYASNATAAAEASEAIRVAIDYQGSGDIECIFFLRSIDGLSEKPELIRKLTEYSIIYRR